MSNAKLWGLIFAVASIIALTIYVTLRASGNDELWSFNLLLTSVIANLSYWWGISMQWSDSNE